MIYFDTTYLLKCYIKEPGWEQVRILARKHDLVACCIYGKIEVRAALHNKLREGDLTRKQLETVFKQTDVDESQGFWTWLPLTDVIMMEVISSIRSLAKNVNYL